MKITSLPAARLFIIEGIAGAGKNTLQKQIEGMLSGKTIYDYYEEELLFTWKHAWIEDIDAIRLNFYEHFLNYCEKILRDDSNAVFILNRFHISYAIFTVSSSPDMIAQYEKIINKLKNLPTFVFVPIVTEEAIEERSTHKERVHPVWALHRNKRLVQGGFATFQEMYSQEQKKIKSLVKEQGIPYSLVDVEINN
ncbi:MAG: hypothetical protein WC863_02620 [Patescibacteria group bacterium]